MHTCPLGLLSSQRLCTSSLPFLGYLPDSLLNHILYAFTYVTFSLNVFLTTLTSLTLLKNLFDSSQ